MRRCAAQDVWPGCRADAKATSAVNLSKLAPDYRPAYDKLLSILVADGGIDSISVAAWRDAVNPAAMWPELKSPREKWSKARAIEKAGPITITKDQVYLL